MSESQGSTATGVTTLIIIRHGEAIHNVAESQAKATATEAALKRGATAAAAKEQAEAARQEILNEPSFRDAFLSPKGQQQAARLRAMVEHRGLPDCPVYASPLSRCLQMASAVFPSRPIAAREQIREKRTGRPCDERREVAALAADFPKVELSEVSAADFAGLGPFRPELQEEAEAVQQRARQFVARLEQEPHRTVVLVAHKAFFRELSHVVCGVRDEMTPAELRVIEVQDGNGRYVPMGPFGVEDISVPVGDSAMWPTGVADGTLVNC
mmetsp:Transcript_84807/g.193402  ORF Transcript_84807/g.193402 Transcript_84807/m.193402 type:complete len:269 (-) Transcript_84807:250-1056(-)